MVASEGHHDIISAMYGERAISVPISTPENPEASGEPEWFFGRNGCLELLSAQVVSGISA